MGIKGKLIGQTEIKVAGDVFHDLIKKNPHHLSTITPQKVQGFTLLSGEPGTVGSVVRWDFTHEGKPHFVEERIEVIDEEKRSIVFKVVGGDLKKLYKNFDIKYHVDIIEGGSLVTWTFDYEKVDVDTPHPGTLLNLALHVLEDIEYHRLNQ